MNARTENGFAAVEALLIFVVVAILGFTGWYVWHSKNTADKTYTSASASNLATRPTATIKTFDDCKKAAGSKLQETYPERCVTKSGKTFTDTAPASQQKYLTIKEWGVRMKLTDKLKDAYYVIKADNPDSAYLSLQSLASAAPDCAADKISVGALFRQTVTEHDTAVGNPSDSSIPGDIKIGDYYYGYVGAQAGCFDSANTAATKLLDDLQPRSGFAAAEKTLEATPGT